VFRGHSATAGEEVDLHKVVIEPIRRQVGFSIDRLVRENFWSLENSVT